MRRRFLVLLLLIVSAFISFNIYNVKADSEKYFLGGMPAGLELSTRGATVVGTCEVVTNDGVISPAKKTGLMVGDIILSINNTEINNAIDIEYAIKEDGDKYIMIDRKGEILSLNITPVKDLSGSNKLGLFVKNGINGIGTITYYTSKGRFASLGHPVFMGENLVEIKKGSLYSCSITGCVRGEVNKPGELKGVFIKEKVNGVIEKNQNNGVFGNVNKGFSYNNLKEVEIGEGKIGEASIFTTVNGSIPKEYSISIVKVDYKENNLKNYVVKINDKELIEETGGIVQGMSGSPIVQDGKLIGAITHVFTNDPLRGFGISIKNMIGS